MSTPEQMRTEFRKETGREAVDTIVDENGIEEVYFCPDYVEKLESRLSSPPLSGETEALALHNQIAGYMWEVRNKSVIIERAVELISEIARRTDQTGRAKQWLDDAREELGDSSHPVSLYRGHRMILVGADWVYADTKEKVSDNPERPCNVCGKPNTPEGHDPCLKTIPSAMNACCGHGGESWLQRPIVVEEDTLETLQEFAESKTARISDAAILAMIESAKEILPLIGTTPAPPSLEEMGDESRRFYLKRSAARNNREMVLAADSFDAGWKCALSELLPYCHPVERGEG